MGDLVEMNLYDLIQALKQAEQTAKTIWPNSTEFNVFCYGENGITRKIVIKSVGGDKMTLVVELDHK